MYNSEGDCSTIIIKFNKCDLTSKFSVLFSVKMILKLSSRFIRVIVELTQTKRSLKEGQKGRSKLLACS